MKLVVFLCIFLSFCSLALSQLELWEKPPPGKPGFCWSDKTGPLEEGEEQIVQCSKATCNKDQTLTIAGCGAVIIDGVRQTVGDLSKPYPQCCPGQGR